MEVGLTYIVRVAVTTAIAILLSLLITLLEEAKLVRIQRDVERLTDMLQELRNLVTLMVSQGEASDKDLVIILKFLYTFLANYHVSV